MIRAVSRRPTWAVLKDARGAAAAEFALVATILAFILVNVVDVGMYVYARMQVENAAQAAAEKVFSACEATVTYDVTTNCSGITGTTGTINVAAQNTSLGTSVTATIGSAGEGWYCANTTGGLTKSSTAISSGQPECKPTVSANSAVAGDYLPITSTYTFTSIFPHATAASLLDSTISKTVWLRVA